MNPDFAVFLFIYFLVGWIVVAWVLTHAYLNDEFYDDDIDWMGRTTITLLMLLFWPTIFFIPEGKQ